MDKERKLRSEVLRYLGYKDQQIDEITEGQLVNALKEIKEIKQTKITYKFMDLVQENDEVGFVQSNFKLPGKDIKEHLKNSKSALLMAVTLGHEVDKRIRYYEKVDLTKALILDACATATIEGDCDDLCEDLEAELAKENRKLTFRYSPGYGDLPISVQGAFLATLDASKNIGLTATSTNILIPRKSVTAIAGVIDIKRKLRARSCANCTNFATCSFKKGDVSCGL
ncbi:MAG TPA: methionine synthase [Natronincola sp.]|nr:methionine synthase [Natronincola sp.]